MKQPGKILRGILIGMTAFLSLTGFLGGVGLLAKLNAPPVETLQGSIFSDFTIPGLALFFFVGGSALLSAILLLRKSPYSLLFSLASGVIIMFFEFVEVMIIGSPAGIAQILQIFYFGLGTLIVSMAMGAWFLDLYDKNSVR
jgi:hypothetical protein